MTTKTCAAYREFGGVWGNEPGFVKLTYDFANDTGATSHTAYYLGKANKELIILDATVLVETAVDSAGDAAVVKIGTTGVADSILTKSWGHQNCLTADARFMCMGAQGQVMEADDYVIAVLSVEALTAGKIHVYLRYANV